MSTDRDRENARRKNGQFGEQHHSAPEASIPARPFVSARNEKLTRQIEQLRAEIEKLEDARRAEDILDMARGLPAEVERVSFRVHYDQDGEEQHLFYEGVHGGGIEEVDSETQNHLHSIAWDFARPGWSYAGDWFETDDDSRGGDGPDDYGYYWLELGGEASLAKAAEYRARYEKERELGGLIPDEVRDGLHAWTERAMRIRAHELGVKRIRFRFPDHRSFLEVEGFEGAHGAFIPFDESNSDHRFISAQAENITYPSKQMHDTGDRITLEV